MFCTMNWKERRYVKKILAEAVFVTALLAAMAVFL